MTEHITFVGNAFGGITVMDGRVKNSREHWQADGLVISIKHITAKMYPSACNLACNEAIARHIPARALRRIGR